MALLWPFKRFEILYVTYFIIVIKDRSHVAQSCYSVIGNKPFLWSKPKFDPP